jgi:hypothetical protein
MDSELVDRIYECSLVPELWPDVLGELLGIAGAQGGSLFVAKAGLQYWTAAPLNRDRTERLVSEGWYWRGQFAARAYAARHAGFLTDLDIFTRDELDQEPLYRDFFRPQGVGSVAGTAIPIPTGEKVSFVLARQIERGPFKRATLRKLDELRPTLRAAH